MIVDGDHRDVPITGDSIEDMVEYVTAANPPIDAWARGLPVLARKPHGSAVPGRDSPARAGRSRYATAFECLVTRSFKDLIVPWDIFQLHGFGVCNEAGVPVPKQAARWMKWCWREDAALVAAGIHNAPTPMINAFRAASRSHLTVIR